MPRAVKFSLPAGRQDYPAHLIFMKAKPRGFLGKHKFYGSTTVGARGQVVIPIRARRDFKLKPGDDLLVSGAHGRFLMAMKISEMEGVMEELERMAREFQKILSRGKSKKS